MRAIFKAIRQEPIFGSMWIAAVLLYFIRLGIGELQSWDEGFYVFRALAIETYGSWIDQTPHALGGLYTTTHPPLGIWLMTASRELLGDTVFASRLPSAIASIAMLVGVFKLLTTFASPRTALIVSTAIGASHSVLWFGKHAQLDLIMLAFATWSCYYFTRRGGEGTRDALVAGVLLGLALLTKFAWALYVLPLLVLIAWFERHERGLARILTTTSIALAIALPWYLYMMTEYPNFLQHAISVAADPGYEPGGKAWYYYFNQLLINLPLIVLIAMGICTGKTIESRRMLLVSALWLASVLVVLHTMSTQMQHFALLLLTPAAILTALGIENMTTRRPNSWLPALVVIPVLYSISVQFRAWLRDPNIELISPPFWLLAAATLVMLMVIYFGRRQQPITQIVNIAVALLVVAAYVRTLGASPAVFDQGASEIAATLANDPRITHLNILHSDVPHDSLAPQLAYYTNGWTAGWLHDRSVSRETADTTLTESRFANSASIVLAHVDRYYKPSDREKREFAALHALLLQHHRRFDSLRGYRFYY